MGNVTRFKQPILPYERRDEALDLEMMINTSNKHLYIKLDGECVDILTHLAQIIYGEDELVPVEHGGTGRKTISKNNILYTSENNVFSETPISEYGKILINTNSGELVSGLNAEYVCGRTVSNDKDDDKTLWTASNIINYITDHLKGAFIHRGSVSSEEDLPHSDYKTGWTYVVTEKGTYLNQTCNKGDLIKAISDYDGEFKVSDWLIQQTNLDDDAVIISDSILGGTRNHIPIYSNDGGNHIIDSGRIMPDGDLVTTTNFATAVTGGVIKAKEEPNFVSVDKDGFGYMNSIDPSTLTGIIPVEKGGTGTDSLDKALKNFGITVDLTILNSISDILPIKYGGTGLGDITKNAMLFASEDNMLSQVLTTSFGRSLLYTKNGEVAIGLNADTVDGLHVTDDDISGLWTAKNVSEKISLIKDDVTNGKSLLVNAIKTMNNPLGNNEEATFENISNHILDICKDGNISPENLPKGKIGYTKRGAPVHGIVPVQNPYTTALSAICVNESAITYVRIPMGYYWTTTVSGYPEITIAYSDLAATIGLTADKLKENETVLGVVGNCKTAVWG